MNDLGLLPKVQQEICELVSHLNELKDVEEGDIAQIKLSKVTGRKVRRALKRLGNQSVKVTRTRDSVSTNEPGSTIDFSTKWADRVRAWEVEPSEITFGIVLGMGGQGQVLEAWVHGNRCAAKKLVVSTNLQHQETTKALKREIKSLSQLHHPNIIRLLHVCTVRNNLCVLVELAERGNFHQVIDDHPDLSPARTFHLLHGVVLGMTVLHMHKPHPILHNDLKPANLLVDNDWTAKIADFGSATGANTTTTRTNGGAGGTLRYQAPEVLDGANGSTSADVYSFGMTLNETVTHMKAWEGKRESQILAMVLKGERPVMPTNCHPFYRLTIERCWAHGPPERPSFGELRILFDDARAAHPIFRVEAAEQSALFVVISSPTKSLEGDDVMKVVEALTKMRSDIIFGYDWAGSNSTDARDHAINWSDADSVETSFWFKGYCERAKGLVTGLVQQGHALQLLCIEGGPISQLEARSMERIQNEILADLHSRGIDDASLRSVKMSFDTFKRRFGVRETGVAGGGVARAGGGVAGGVAAAAAAAAAAGGAAGGAAAGAAAAGGAGAGAGAGQRRSGGVSIHLQAASSPADDEQARKKGEEQARREAELKTMREEDEQARAADAGVGTATGAYSGARKISSGAQGVVKPAQTSNVGKYQIGQRVDGLAGGTISGVIVGLQPNVNGATSG
jgi:serine/threonine protein kinase